MKLALLGLACLALVLCAPASAQEQAKTPAEELAAKLLAARDEGERAALLAARKELVAPELRKALIAAGDAHRRQAEYPRALAAYELARRVAESADDREGVARSLHYVAVVRMAQGEYGPALELFAQSLAIKEQLGDKRDIARTLYNMAGIHAEQHNLGEALRLYRRTHELREAVDDKVGVGDSLLGIGLVYDAQGNYPLALEFFRRALAIFEAAGDREGVAYAYNNIGNMLNAAGEHAAALEHFQKSLALLEALKQRRYVAQALHNIGNVHEARGQYDAALDFYRRSLALKEEIGDRTGQANSLLNMGHVHLKQGEAARSVELSARAADMARRLLRRDTLWAALATKGSAHLRLGQTAEARAALEESVAVIEEMRALVAGGSQDRQVFFENKVLAYLEMVKLLAGQGRYAEALEYAERSKARVLLDVLGGGRAPLDKRLTEGERARERELGRRLVALNNDLAEERQAAAPRRARLEELEKQLEQARHDLAAFQTALFNAHPELRVRRGESKPASLADAAELLPDAQTALLEYAVADDRTFLFVLTRGAQQSAPLTLRVYEVAAGREELARRAQEFRGQLAARGLAFRRPARELYDLLLKPAAEQLRGKTRLVFVPDAGLWELPFQALQTAEGRYLLEESEVAYAQSLTVMRETARARAARRKAGPAPAAHALLAFGPPPAVSGAAPSAGRPAALPEAERQVKALGELYGPSASRVYTGAAAREERLKSEAGGARLVHLATHGVLNDRSPLYSHVLLAHGEGGEDGLLEAWEIMNLDLRAELVVLSACETARGRAAAGEGVIGMTWALFVAGSPSTVVSQWKVEESSTTELMLEFHRRLRGRPGEAPRPPAEALRAAALKLLRSERHAHPFYWAAFVLVGA